MKFAGFVKTSLIDFPGKVAATVFTQGCNFRCGFCHNPDLIPYETEQPETLIDDVVVLEYLEKRKGLLDGVVITGGEPLIRPEIEEFISKVKSLGYLVKLDTNGSNPALLAKLIEAGQVDYVAMDIKGAPADYIRICGFEDSKKIGESIAIIMNSGLDYEFRTTVLPYYHKLESFHALGISIKGAKRYTVQGFRPRITLDKSLESEKSFSPSDLQAIEQIMADYVVEVVVHENLA